MSRYNCVDWSRACPEPRPCSFYSNFKIDEPELPNLHECPVKKGVMISFVKVDHEGRPLADVRAPAPIKAELVATVVETGRLF